MNSRNCSTRNFLIANSASEKNMEILINLCINQAEKSKTSLLLSSKSLLNFHYLKNIDKHKLNRILIMYFDDIDKMITKLLELHNWTITPTVVILDFDEFFCSSSLRPPTNQTICLLISSLLNYMKYLKNIDGHLPISIILINTNNISENLIQTLVNLYYYRSAYSDIESLINVLPITGSVCSHSLQFSNS